ncbi:type II/IV secretion system protein [Candidatus Peregrinibacteria bacterium]|nr:type II/IV secretion system protein [Candidatus Peregrinibacteria bacterium]
MADIKKNTQTQISDQALGKINRDMEEKAAQERAKDLKLPYVDVGMFPINPDILHLLKQEDAKRAFVMPFFKSGKKLKIAVTDPAKPETQEVLKNLESMGYKPEIHLASNVSLNEAFRHYASAQYKLKIETKNVVEEKEIKYEKELENLSVLKNKIAALPSEEALNTLHVSAIKAGASDIHYQPEETECAIRFRIDGVLHNVFSVGKDVYANLANQLKYKAGMKLNITTVPQDGRFRFIVNERKIDVRVSSIPTEYGESFVCRILDSGKHFGNFDELGFTGKSLEILNKACELPQGMVLVTGPTSSGKTTTLYVLLNKFNQPEVKIITLEDPVEYHLKGITQSQINEKRGYNFADGLRSILRQDPDVVMIGEIRDLETAQACAQAALTGHVVLSTLHTNSASETIPRLITIGLPPFMVAPSLSIVIAQRLVRRVCDKCKKERPATDEEKTIFEKTLQAIKTVDASVSVQVPQTVKVQQGCEVCSVTGFRGQMIVSEVLHADNEIKDAIQANKSANDIFAIARKKGMITMYEDGILKVIQGHTTLDELHRVINQ